MMDDYGYFGQGLSGYVHYNEATSDGPKGSGGGSPNGSGPNGSGGKGKGPQGGIKVFLVILAVYILLKVIASFLY
jgi:hypothetical protein